MRLIAVPVRAHGAALAAVGLLSGAVGLVPARLAAQDVEMLAEHYGTTPPAAYFEEIARNPDAYRPARGLRARLGADATLVGPGGAALRSARGPAAVLGRRVGGVLGTFKMPLLLGLYSDTPGIPTADVGASLGVSLDRDVVQTEFFDGPNSRFATIPEFYLELSSGRDTLIGETRDWFEVSLSGNDVAGTSNGLSASDDVGEFIFELLSNADAAGVDWGQYDNDGPDRIPNSGDDDGFVDLLAVMHPTRGAECGGSGAGLVWSHYWQLAFSASQGAFSTSTPSANGGVIMVDDYTIQPVLSCNASEINEIGVIAHELGHGFGLPDLYAVGASHGGVGRWGLMGTGPWGCDGQGAEMPCHMTAWSKEVLGWLNVTTLAPDADLGVISLDPVETTGDVVRIDAGDGSGDYYLLENRQRLGFDATLPEEGLLVWQIDAEIVNSQWAGNMVNTSAGRMGVWLRQADGQNALAQAGQRGDAGDPFPGTSGAMAFHAGTVPSAFTYNGLNGLGGISENTAAGVTLLGIQQVVDRMEFQALTRYQTVTLESAGGASGSVFTVDGTRIAGTTVPVTSAPFQTHTVEADGGVPNGVDRRLGFQSWSDGQPRVRGFTTTIVDSTLTATYANPEVRFNVTLQSPVPGVVPGALVLNPESETGWIREATSVSVFAQANTGVVFTQWLGDLAGQMNPTTVVMTAPSTSTAIFDLTYVVSSNDGLQVDVGAASNVDIRFTVANANEPLTWATSGLPPGLFFLAGTERAVRGAALAMGDFVVTVRATDAIGLTDSVDVDLTVGPPDVGLQTMAEPFLSVGLTIPALETFLDLEGDGDGTYDLGDFRAWVLANPNHPATTPAAAALARTPVEPIVIPLFGETQP